MQSTATRDVVSNTRGSQRWQKVLTLVMLILLAAQFLVGMLVNLFVTVPSAHPGTNAPEYFSGVVTGVLWVLGHGTLWLLLHSIAGLALFLCSLLLLGLAIASRRRAWIISSIFGLLGIMTAGFNGASFLNYGHDFSSLLMSIGFLLAVIPYMIGIYVTH
jgi:branched-subunit amino acid transport protein